MPQQIQLPDEMFQVGTAGNPPPAPPVAAAPAAPAQPPAQAQVELPAEMFQVGTPQSAAPTPTPGQLPAEMFQVGVPEKKPEVQQKGDDPGFFYRNIFKTLLGTDAGDMYDQIRAQVPAEYSDTWAGKFALELGKAPAEVVDAALSPIGLGLMAAHMDKRLRPFAAAADLGFSLVQAGRTVTSMAEAGVDPSPENVATAFKDILYTYGIVKTKTAAMKPYKPRNLELQARAQEYVGKLEELRPEPEDTKAVLKQKTEQRAEVWKEVSTPANAFEAALYKIYQTPGVKSLAAMLDVPKPTVLEMGQYMVDQRRALINVEMQRLRVLQDQLHKNATPEERDVQRMGYAMQGDATPEQAGLSDSAANMLDALRDYNKGSDETMRAVWGDDLILQDPNVYLSQIWTPKSIFGENTFEQAGQRGAMAPPGTRIQRDRFLRKRSIESYKSGMEDLGWEPKFRDVADIIAERRKTAISAMANHRMASTLRDIGALVTEDQARNNPQLYGNWPQLESRSLARAAYVGKTAAGETILEKRPVRVNPDIAMAVKAIFGEGFRSTDEMGKTTLFGHLERVRSLSKQANVQASLFHNWAVNEQLQALTVAAGKPFKALRSWFVFDREFWKGMHSGAWEMVGKDAGETPPLLRPEMQSLAMPWIEATAEFTGTSDREASLINFLSKLDTSKGPFVGRVAKRAAKLYGGYAGMLDRGLWDYYLPGNMLSSMESTYANEIAKIPNVTPAIAFALRRSIAKFHNKAFGTEPLESLLLSPRTRQALYMLLFAPQWTLSNMRVVTTGYENEIERKLRNKWIGGAAFSWFVGSQLANYASSAWADMKRKYGDDVALKMVQDPTLINKVVAGYGKDWKGRFTWDNPGLPMKVWGTEHPALSVNANKIYDGKNPDGSARYIQFGRGFGETFGKLLAPDGFGLVSEIRKELAGKLSSPIKKGLTAVSGGTDPGGYEVYGRKTEKPHETAILAMLDMLELGLPIGIESVKGKIERALLPSVVREPLDTQEYNLPVRKGLTLTDAIKYYTETMAIRKDQPDLAKKRLERLFAVAQDNNIRIGTIVKAYQDNQRQRRRTERGPVVTFTSGGNRVRTAPPPK